MGYDCRDWQPAHPDAPGQHEELLILQERLPGGEKGAKITYVRRYLRHQEE